MKRLVYALTAAMALATVPAVPALADQPTTFTPPPMVRESTNPCGGESHQVTLNATVSQHGHQNNGLFHVGYTGTTDSGFELTAGVEQAQMNNNVVRGTFTFQWRHPDGLHFREQGKFVINFQKDQMMVDLITSRCLGND